MSNLSVAVHGIVDRVDNQILGRGFRAANALRNAELEVLNGRGGGRTYKKPGGGTYQASSPGQPPARRSGHLREAWSMSVSGGSGSCHIELISDTFYAGYLEHGTSKMAARPFVDRIAQNAKPEIIKIYSEPYV